MSEKTKNSEYEKCVNEFNSKIGNNGKLWMILTVVSIILTFVFGVGGILLPIVFIWIGFVVNKPLKYILISIVPMMLVSIIAFILLGGMSMEDVTGMVLLLGGIAIVGIVGLIIFVYMIIKIVRIYNMSKNIESENFQALEFDKHYQNHLKDVCPM